MRIPSLLFITLAACATDVVAPTVPELPRDPAGAFAVHGQHDVAAMPPSLVADLVAAADDPGRYLIARMIDELPDGAIKTIARDAAPWIAAYFDDELSVIAPRLRRGLAEAAAELASIAAHFGTTETWLVTHQGAMTRVITGYRFLVGAAPVDVAFADRGLADVIVNTRVVLDATGQLTIGEHAVALSYGRLLRLGLDRAVVPSIEPGATSVAGMLAGLVDCKHLGAIVAEALDLAVPDLFATACTTALAAAASELDARIAQLDSTPLELDVTGSAFAIDADRDGTIDLLDGGVWSGPAAYVGTFTGWKY